MKNVSYILLIIVFCIVLINCKKQELEVETVFLKNDSTIEKEMDVNTVPLINDSLAENNVFEAKISVENIEKLPILFVLNGYFGYLNKELEIIIPPLFDRGYNYTDQGYTWIRHMNNRNEFICMILDVEGKTLFQEYTSNINILYDDIISYRSKNDNLFKIVRFRDNTVIADKLGQEAIYSEDGVILVRNFYGSEWVFIDLYGKRILSDITLYRNTKGFREERAVIIEGEDREIKILNINGDLYNYLDLYRTNWYFHEGLLAAQTTDGRTGYINRNGLFSFIVPIIPYEPDYQESPLNATDFNNGYALIQTIENPPVWRVINNLGEYISNELNISMASVFVDGLSCVKLYRGGYGYINTYGEMVIEPIFDSADSFHRGYARIVYQGRDGIINTEGKIYWSDEFIR